MSGTAILVSWSITACEPMGKSLPGPSTRSTRGARTERIESVTFRVDPNFPPAYEELRSTPEGRLWTFVIARAAADISETLKWIETGYQEQLETLTKRFHSGSISRERLRKLRKLTVQRRRILSSSSREELSSARRFFFAKDTGFSELASLLGYDPQGFRDFLMPISIQIRSWERKLSVSTPIPLLARQRRVSSRSGRSLHRPSSPTTSDL